MGENNSSLTRVVPVFDRLIEIDSTGRSWLPGLLGSASLSHMCDPIGDVGSLLPGHKKYWGENERRLPPPSRLLELLIDSLTVDAVRKSGDTGEVFDKRMALARKEPAAVKAALDGLRSGDIGRKWYALEGPSSPDAFLETNRIVLVVEGKRTERACTTKTKFMPKRSQLLRHMDAAFEIADGRRVLGLLIVEGVEPNPYEPSEHWKEQAAEQVSESMLSESLPHRTEDKRAVIRNGVLGALTWQRVCRDNGIDWPPHLHSPPRQSVTMGSMLQGRVI